ncbi:MAG: methylated-DNA--[protein]-cysteine S-methyltransferase [Deltaproteobacteria bacterium]|nr:methylated-DNA--[protein]-cysteine S-methyltransferase [Deltaproteobacteria bacterium]
MIFTSFDSHLGKIFIARTSSGICRLSIAGSANDFKRELRNIYKQDIDIITDDNSLKQAILELKQYLKGIPTVFNYRLDLKGTPFQKKVWNELRKIPFGKTLSYKDIAKRINKPNAHRAVGNACGKNPIPIIIPCHRVIAADGKLGGYSSGLDIKKKLLKIEKVLCCKI